VAFCGTSTKVKPCANADAKTFKAKYEECQKEMGSILAVLLIAICLVGDVHANTVGAGWRRRRG
jgi:hypothetical protein